MNKAQIINLAGKTHVLGRMLRWAANRYEDGSVVTIRSGLAEGMRWRRYHRYVNGYWTGQYEYPMQRALAAELAEGGVFYDVGANAGFFSLIATKIIGQSGQVVSFDPDPENCESIAAQIEENGLAEIWRVSQTAVGAGRGTTIFERAAPGSPMGKIVDALVEGGHSHVVGETFNVPVIGLDNALESHRPPTVIKMDIEGAEVMAMEGASRIIDEIRPTWVIEMHGPECESAVMGRLRKAGYTLTSIDGSPRLAGNEMNSRHVLARPENR